MKRILFFLCATLLFAAGCGKSDPVVDPGKDDPVIPDVPKVTTAVVTRYDATTAYLGGSMTGVEIGQLAEVGVQYVIRTGEAAQQAWEGARELTTTACAGWELIARELEPETEYAVRAFVRMAEERFYGDAIYFETMADDLPDIEPQVVTADVTDYDGTTALLGGSMSGAEPKELNTAGVEYVVWTDAPTIDEVDWTAAVSLTVDPATSWSIRATGLTDQTQYAVRAFVGVGTRLFYGEPKSFFTYSPEREPLTVAQLRAKHLAGDDVSAESVRGYVALSIPENNYAANLAAGTVILYDNTGEPASALTLYGGGDREGIGAAGLQKGDYVEVSLAGAEPDLYKDMIPQYGAIARDMVRVLSSGHTIEPVWATPAQLVARTSEYVCSPVKLSRVYAEKPGKLFSVEENYYTDGEGRVKLYAKPENEIGKLTQNAATGTLYGICSYYDKAQVVPTDAADVASFVGEAVGPNEGDPAIEILNTDYYEFIPQGETRTVACRITGREGLRLFADMRHIDQNRYAVDIEGDRVRITARPNDTGVTADYTNCYLYLAESKDAAREATATLRITQLSSIYESIPSLIQANGGKLSSRHEAVVNGYATEAMKLGSGSYTGHYTSAPLGIEGDRKLVLYAVGWSESKHEAGTLYLRVEGGGSVSTTAVPLTVNEGATGQAPFVLAVGDSDRYEVELRDMTPGSAISFSTSPDFDYRKDDRTGRALLFGVQVSE